MDLFPLDVLNKILLFLPIRKAISLACVCKRFLSILTSHAYTKTVVQCHIYGNRAVNRTLLPKEIPTDYVSFIRDYYSSTLERDYLYKHMQMFVDRITHSGYCAQGTASYQILNTKTLLSEAQWLSFCTGQFQSIPVNLFWTELGEQHNLRISLSPSVMLSLANYSKHNHHHLREVFQPPQGWWCSYEHPKYRRVAWGCLKKVIAAMRNQRCTNWHGKKPFGGMRSSVLYGALDLDRMMVFSASSFWFFFCFHLHNIVSYKRTTPCWWITVRYTNLS